MKIDSCCGTIRFDGSADVTETLKTSSSSAWECLENQTKLQNVRGATAIHFVAGDSRPPQRAVFLNGKREKDRGLGLEGPIEFGCRMRRVASKNRFRLAFCSVRVVFIRPAPPSLSDSRDEHGVDHRDPNSHEINHCHVKLTRTNAGVEHKTIWKQCA